MENTLVSSRDSLPGRAAALVDEILTCRLCASRFALTVTGHRPRPVPWFRSPARLLIAGQAPGARVHASGRPFTDASGDRLRDWLGLEPEVFYDRDRIAIVPMAFCFPGYSAKAADLPPPPICATTWRDRVMAVLPAVRLILPVGGAAIRWHLGRAPMTESVRNWRQAVARDPSILPLPHPSWRNTGWLKANPWFAAEVLPELRARVARVLEDE